MPDVEVAGRFGEIVAAHRGDSSDRCLMLGEKRIELTEEMADILSVVAESMKQGLAVSVVPQNTRMTTQQAADFLGISRSTLVRMLDAGEIAYEKVRRHRRLFLSDVLDYQKRQRRRADDALSDMVADAQAMKSYDIDPVQMREVLAQVRAEG
ncbi:helix-turn-helix domain-containing protein [Actinomyces sp. B33]|uniref:helix-turn-helix domain-containing protein n=1 Tax=Actinomyces sp. B33 TaxID=2942131 RepID=UPI00233FFFA5|nr:helix-turn-helix domain-containing protein [Actinomyces sp. B33]MDC4233726.1 helix-turn-helix domain-containing protein [Actinomyces sp. B33]